MSKLNRSWPDGDWKNTRVTRVCKAAARVSLLTQCLILVKTCPFVNSCVGGNERSYVSSAMRTDLVLHFFLLFLTCSPSFLPLNPLTTLGHLPRLSSASEIDRSILSEPRLSPCVFEYLHSSSFPSCHPATIPSAPRRNPSLSLRLSFVHSAYFSLSTFCLSFQCIASASLGVCVCVCVCVCACVCVCVWERERESEREREHW